MPKTIAPLNDFSAGLNTSVNIRDIGDKEFIKGENVDSAIQGRLRCVGEWKVLSLPDYTTGPVATLSVQVVGSDYTTANGLATTGGSGTGCTVDINVIGGGIDSVIVNAVGSGYVKNEVLGIVQLGGLGGSATITSLHLQGEGSINIIDDFPVNAGYGLQCR